MGGATEFLTVINLANVFFRVCTSYCFPKGLHVHVNTHKFFETVF